MRQPDAHLATNPSPSISKISHLQLEIVGPGHTI